MTKEQLLKMFEPIEIKPTYCGKIISICRKALKDLYKTEDLHYTYDGIRSVVLDEKNNQKYEIIVRPIK